MLGEDFCYDGIWLSSFGMKLFDPDTDQQFVGRDIDRAEITSARNEPNHYTTKYSDTLELSFLIIKYDETYTQADMELRGDDIHQLRRWLESPKLPTELFVQGREGDDDVYYYGVFTSVQPFLVTSTCYGLKLTFKCNSQYGYSAPLKKRVFPTSSDCTVDVKLHSDESDRYAYIYPVIMILANGEFSGNETISIQNVTDGNTMELSLPGGASSIQIDCRKKCICDENRKAIPLSSVGMNTQNTSNADFISTNYGHFYFLRLLSGRNNISVTFENCSTVSEVDFVLRWSVKTGGF